MTKRILITGGAGFIGSHTADKFIEQGHQVRILDVLDLQVHGAARQVPAYLNPAAEFIEGDVRDLNILKKALTDIDAVYHFASLTGVTQSMKDIHHYTDINVTGTAALLDVIVNGHFNIEKIVLSSSRAVYGEGTYYCPNCQRDFAPALRAIEQLESGKWEITCPVCGNPAEARPTREDKVLQPLSIYAENKRMQEDLLRMTAETYQIPAVILRYFNVYGPRQALGNPYTGIAPIFCTRISAGKPIIMYEDGLPIRDFVHVYDVVQANVKALDYARDTVLTANVGTGEKLTILDMAQAICDEMGAERNIEFSGQFRVGDIRGCYADLTQSRSTLGYEPGVTFRQGVAELIQWVGVTAPQNDSYETSVQAMEKSGLMRHTRN
jgi:dTDP-L-rhamnose 4-epimerase